MSKDIRSFFKVVSKKPSDGSTKSPDVKAKKAKPLAKEDSDDDEIITETPEKPKSKLITGKRRVRRISSESEDEHIIKLKNPKIIEEKLQPVNIDDIFGDIPVKQSKVVPLPKTEHEVPEKKHKEKKTKKKKANPEIGVHADEDFEKTLLELDDDLIEGNFDLLDKTIEEAKIKEKNKIKEEQGKGEKKQGIAVLENTPNTGDKKRKQKNSEGPTSKKPKLEHTDSGIDADQEAFEKRRYSAMLYQKYKNRSGPKHHGEKELPQGKPDSLCNLTFLRTGVLDSLAGEEFENLVKEHGGRVVHSISKKVNYLVVGDDPGPVKLDKARGMNIPQISEDELLDMILIKSGMIPKFTKHSSDSSLESGIGTEEELFVTMKKQKLSSRENKLKSDEEEDIPVAKKHDIVANKNKTCSKPNLDKLTNSSKKVATLSVESNEIHDIKQLEQVTLTQTQNNLKEESTKKLITITKTVDLPQIENPNVAISDEAMSWTEKYKPKDLKSIIGQQDASSNMNKLKKWLQNWYRNQLPEVKKKIPRPSPWAKNDDGAFYKAALLSGPPGVGKTTTATLLSKELGFDVVEFNASDTRSKRLLHEEVSQLLSTNTIAGYAAGKKTIDKKRVLLMDEVDGMAGNEDRGGMQELINLIKNTSIPIICMCNDRNHQKMRSLVNYCFDLKFNKPKLEQIRGAMMSICYKEDIEILPNALSEIITGTGGDIRQTLNHLAMWTAADKNLSLATVERESKASKKDTVLGPWEVIRLVFTESEQKTMNISDKSKLFFYDYSLGPLFVQENYLNVTPNCDSKEVMKRVSQAADAISMGDLIDSKIRGSNNWSLLESQAVYSSVLPGFYMAGTITKKINFPGWLGKNSSATKRKRMLSELHIHARISTSGSKLAMKLDYLVPLRNAIIAPLRKLGTDGVHRAIEVMKAYHLLRDDLTNLLELCHWKDQKNPFNDIDSKVKSAFTRAYNKEAPLLPFAHDAGVSKKKSSSVETDTLLEGDDEYVDDDDDGTEETNDVSADAMIKVKTKTDDKNKKGKAKAGTSKAKDSTKAAKGRSKKSK